MHAVVLVGGFGTRLRPLTFTVPKPLLPVCNIVLLERLMVCLARGGVSHAVLSLGFQPEPFLKAFPENICGGVELSYAIEDRPLDTGGAIGFAARQAGIDQRNETFIVANGDVITSLDLASLVSFHRDRGATGTIHLTPVEDPSQYGVVETDSSGKIMRFVEKPSPGQTVSQNINAGTYVLEASALELMPGTSPLSIERIVFPKMVSDGVLFGMQTTDYWIDAGAPKTYVRANLDMISNNIGGTAEATSQGAKIAKSATVINSVIGPNCVVGENAEVVRSVLIAGARVDENAVVVDSAVIGHVGAFAQVSSCLIGQDGQIDSGAVLRDAKVPDPAKS